MVNNKKRVLIGSLIGVIILFIVVIGATYAFFTFGVVNNSEDTTISIKTGSGNSIELVGGITNFHINIDASDMSLSKVGKEYYATDVVGKKYEETEEAGTKVLGTISAKGSLEGTQNCSATLDIVVDGSMKSFLQEGDLILTVKQGEISKIIDLSNLPSNKPAFEFGLNSGDVKTLDVNMKLTNRLEDQKDLAGKTLSVSISVSDFVCSNDDTNLREPLVALTATTDAQYLKKAEDRDELLRFVGTHTDAEEGRINNYICFGTNDKDECTKEPDTYLYRIIGITNENINKDLELTSGQLKLIKATPINETTKWSNIMYESINWPSSLIPNILNTSFLKFITKSSSNSQYNWLNIISIPKWYNSIVTNETWSLKYETGSTSDNYYLGLMYASDYYNSNDGKDLGNSWLSLEYGISNYELPDNIFYEWTMTAGGLYNDRMGAAWANYPGGISRSLVYDINAALRPVFYLTPYTNLIGSGSENDPFIIIPKNKPQIKNVKLLNDNGNSIEVVVDAYSNDAIKEYCYKLIRENEYTCTNSKNYTFESLDDNLDYSLEVYVKDNNNFESDVYKVPLRVKPAVEVLNRATTSEYLKPAFDGDELTRFIGNYEAAINGQLNNFICFGTSDLQKCLNNKDSYLYRIIGITNDKVNSNLGLLPNQLKIIKALPLKNSYGNLIKMSWVPKDMGYNCGQNGVKCEWDYENITETEGPILRQYLNSTFFDTIKNNNEKLGNLKWDEIIESPKWYKGPISSASNNEKEPLTNNNFKIGLMYLSDYYNSILDHSVKNSWLYNDYGIGDSLGYSEDEWTMTSIISNGYYYAWQITSSTSSLSPTPKSYTNNLLRPVMYLGSNVKLSGKGTADFPFIISVE